MHKKIALTAALIMAVGLSGCASTDSVKKAQATADEAKSLAQQAASDASSAKSSAETAASDAADAKRMAAGSPAISQNLLPSLHIHGQGACQ